jgi:NAD(P)-dependent dehydrogenase (short-subunit alcohol dehydrogenase family)
MDMKSKVAVVTGAGSGIGQATAIEFARRDMKAIALADLNLTVHEVAMGINDRCGGVIAFPYVGDTTSASFRQSVFDDIERRAGVVNVCVPAAGITRDALAVKLDKTTGEAKIYAEELFRQVVDVNLIAPVYWALEMIARIIEDRHQRHLGPWHPQEQPLGCIIFIGSVSSQGNKGQVAYAATKRGLEGVASTLMKEAMYWGVRCGVIHPGFTDTKMVRAMGEEYINKNIIPYTQLKRLIRPDEIADTICFMILNHAISGEVWCDAGWHPSA